MQKHIATVTARFWLFFSKGSATGQAAWFANRICRSTIITGYPGEPFRKLKTGSGCVDYSDYNLPDFFVQLQVAYILGDVIQPAQQVHRIYQGSNCRLPQAGSNSQPLLLTHLHHYPVFYLLEINRQGGFSA